MPLWGLHRAGRSDEATEKLRLALELDREVGVVNIEGFAWELQAEILHDRGDREGAVEALRKAHRLLSECDEAAALRVSERLASLDA